MKFVTRSSLILAICLSALAGYIDAIGFLQLGGYFVSFMSGNTTRLAVVAQEGDFAAARLLVSIIVCFVIGSMAGALIGYYARMRRRAAVLATVAAVLALAAGLSECGMPTLSIVCMALAMGAENAVFQKDGNVMIGLTYMTGTLVKIGQKLAAQILGIERFAWMPYVLLWCGLLLGGFAGATVHNFIGLRGLWFGALAALCLALVSIKHRHQDGPHI